MPTPCQKIANQIGELFTCSHVNEYIRIRTPYLYPDGDVIDLFLQEDLDVAILTDLGETLRWLRMQSTAKGLTQKQQEIIADICLTYGVDLSGSVLVVTVEEPDELAIALTQLAQASLRVAGLVPPPKLPPFVGILEEVALFLTEQGIPFKRNVKFPGRSGRRWKIDFHIKHPNRSALVSVLCVGNPMGVPGKIKSVVTPWYDLTQMKKEPDGFRLISLFDDGSGMWTPEDFKLAEELSEVAYWTQPEEFAEKLVK